MNRSMKLSGLVVSLISAIPINAGCYSTQPKLNIDYEQTSLKYDGDFLRIGVEPLDTGAESRRAFWYDLREKNILSVFLRFENKSEKEEISFDKREAKFYDSCGIEWSRPGAAGAAIAASRTELSIKGGLIGASLGILVIPMIPIVKKGFEAEYKKRIYDFNEQTFADGKHVIYPEGVMSGNLLFINPEEKKGKFSERVNGSELVIPFKLNNQYYERRFKIGKASDYLEREKNEKF